jgi:hypothetical protein
LKTAELKRRQARAYYRKHKHQWKEYKNRQRANPQRYKALRRKWHLWEAFGLREDDFNALLKKQSDRCAICGASFNERVPTVDHDHSTEKVRGLLCGKCNSGLGMFGDNKELLSATLAYLD